MKPSRLKKKKRRQFLSRSAEETLRIAGEFSKKLKGGDVIGLEGNLGSGKTTFIKGIALGLGLKDQDEVKSPTFVLMHVYPARMPLYHFDLYRLEGEKDLATVGLEDFAADPHAITCIEWAEKAGRLLPRRTYHVQLEVAGKNERKIYITRQPVVKAVR